MIEESFEHAERLRPGDMGERQQLLIRHARGLALLYAGRCREAQENLEAAITLGETVGDTHLVAFERVYRAEALIFQAEYGEAGRLLETTVAASCAPAVVRGMALSRLAYLHALWGDARSSRAAGAAHAGLSRDRPIPFIDAWDHLYLGWACALDPGGGPAFGHLAEAERFFRRRRVAPALALALFARAEAHLIARETAWPGASEEVASCGSALANVLWSVLRARLAFAAPGSTRPSLADLIAHAGASLVGNPLAEWSLILRALRARVEGGDEPIAAIEDERERFVRERAAAGAERALADERWRRWTDVPSRGPQAAAGVRAPLADTTAAVAGLRGADAFRQGTDKRDELHGEDLHRGQDVADRRPGRRHRRRRLEAIGDLPEPVPRDR